ncbi:MAG: cyclase family protein [Oceanicoccus sp.]
MKSFLVSGFLILALTLVTNTSWADTAVSMTTAEYDALMAKISNAGRWGADDELGTLNNITPARSAAAAALVTQGISVSLSLEIDKVKSPLNENPLEHQLYTALFAGHEVAGDTYSVTYHGTAHSHLDGLAHWAYKGHFYNNVPYAVAKPTGAEKLGVQNIGERGVVSRGVLIDMPRHFGKEWLEPGYAITIADFEAWEKDNDVTIGAGDVLLVRTGRWLVTPTGAFAGLHASTIAWLKERDVAMLGCDGVSDVVPSGVEDVVNPVHTLVIAGLGMPMMDNLGLEAVAAEAVKQKRSTFLFMAAPLRIPGGTGAPINPLAVF